MKRIYADMTPEQRALAQRENRGLLRFIGSFLLSCVYGAIAFFAVWAWKEALPVLLLRLFPGEADGDPARLYIAIAAVSGGLILLITFFLLWFRLNREELSQPQRLRILGLFCLGAAAALGLCRLLEWIAAR